ncbi:MAG TPA: peptidylprolyl isomerase [Deferrimonas sp.]
MSQPVAVVNGKPVSRQEFDNAVQGFAMELHRKTMEHLCPEEAVGVRELALEKLLARELVYQHALSLGVVADEEAINAEKAKTIANFPDEKEFYATLAKAGIDPAAYHRMLRQDLTVNRMTAAKLAEVTEPTEAEVEDFYRLRPERILEPARIRACHILVRIQEGQKEEALALINDLKGRTASEDFAALARDHSACPSASRGGDLGYFNRGSMVRPFEDAAFSQPVGAVGEVVETPFGLHLIKVLDRREDRPLSLEEAAPRIRRFLKEEAGARLLGDWVAELRARAVIEILS